MIVSLHGYIFISLKIPTLREAAEVLKKAGVGFISLPLLRPEWANPETITKSEIAKIKETVKSYDVGIKSFGTIWPSTDDYWMWDYSERGRQVDYCRKLVDLAVEFDVKVMNMHLTTGIPMPYPRNKGLKLIAGLWKEACKYAEPHGVCFGAEGSPVKEYIDLARMVDSPSFGICLPQGRGLFQNEISTPDSIRAAGDLIKLVHLADDNGGIPGSGGADWNQIFKAFKDIGYDGEFVLECELGKDYVGALREAKRFIETKWRQT